MEKDLLRVNRSQVTPEILSRHDLILLIDYNSNSEQEILNRFNYIKPHELFDLKDAGEMERRRFERERAGKIKYVQTGNFENHPMKWKCFEFRKTEQISLNFLWDQWEIGFPERENFKLSTLEINRPVEIKINGKRDFSLTGRRKRTFIEQNFIIEYLGMANQVELDDIQNIRTEKVLPVKPKEINLLKPLF